MVKGASAQAARLRHLLRGPAMINDSVLFLITKVQLNFRALGSHRSSVLIVPPAAMTRMYPRKSFWRPLATASA